METKKYLYAAVGAPVTVLKAAQDKVEEIREKLSESTKTFTGDAQKQVDSWATEGESFVTKLTESKAIDDITAKVDFDQMQTQVNRLRDQLEDLVETWRANFQPASKEEAPKEAVKVEEPKKAPAKKAPAATKAPAAKTTTAAKKAPAQKAPQVEGAGGH